jgi:hypothetical protein
MGISDFICAKMMSWTSLNPQLKFVAFWSKFFLFVRMTSFNVGFASFVMFSIPQISQTVFNGVPFSTESNVNEAYNTFHTKLMGIVDNHMPVKKCTQTSAFHEPTTKKSNIQQELFFI